MTDAEFSEFLENDRLRHNEFIDQLQSDVEFPPLIEFLERLKETVSTSSHVTIDHSGHHVPAAEERGSFSE